MVAGSVGEIAACWVRVPTENVKQKLQAGVYPRMTECVRGILAEGGASGFYVGCASAPPPPRPGPAPRSPAGFVAAQECANPRLTRLVRRWLGQT